MKLKNKVKKFWWWKRMYSNKKWVVFSWLWDWNQPWMMKFHAKYWNPVCLNRSFNWLVRTTPNQVLVCSLFSRETGHLFAHLLITKHQPVNEIFSIEAHHWVDALTFCYQLSSIRSFILILELHLTFQWRHIQVNWGYRSQPRLLAQGGDKRL